MVNSNYILILITFQALTTIINANLFAGSKLAKPKKLSNCKAQLDDGTIVDLTSLDNAASPRYSVIFYK